MRSTVLGPGSSRRRVSAWAAMLFAALSSAAAAQESPSVPGPFVVDVRGVMSGLPTSPEFYPPINVNTFVPERGFGLEAGAHVYPISVGPARLGLGASVYRVRGSIDGATAVLTAIAPQISMNFGSRDGWSHLSAGYGPIRIATSLTEPSGEVTTNTNAINVGGGARWFLNGHVAATFDVRFFVAAASGATPGSTLFVASAGFAVR